MLRLILFCLLSSSAIAAEPEWGLYDELLNAYVSPGTKDNVSANLVDYRAIDRDPRFTELVSEIREFDVRLLNTDQEKLAFYINAYNILTINLILENWPVDSIRDIGNFFRGPWDRVVLENDDGRLTLDDIEHGIIRKLNEPRIHFAVNCASLGCPDLRREAYRAELLDTQLEEQTRSFLNNPKGLRIENGDLRISRIFDWYEEDFDPFGGPAGFIGAYLPDLNFADVDANLRYNWSLNAR